MVFFMGIINGKVINKWHGKVIYKSEIGNKEYFVQESKTYVKGHL